MTDLQIVLTIAVCVVLIQFFYHRGQRKLYRKELYQVALPYFKSQMNPHFIKNLMQSINYLILFDSKEKASSCLKKFSLLVDQILKYSELQLIPLEKEISLLENYAALQHLRFPNKFDFVPVGIGVEQPTILVEEGIDLENQMIPPMVIQPFLENAIVHGLEPLQGKGYLRVEFRQTRYHLLCRIIDNGIGRKASKELNSKDPLSRKENNGIATKNIRNRLRIIEKSLSIPIGFLIEDLNDEKQSGTVVTLSFPKHMEAMQGNNSLDFESLILNK